MKIKLKWEVDTRDVESLEKVVGLVSRAAVVLGNIKTMAKERVRIIANLDVVEAELMEFEGHLREIGEEK